MSAARSLRKWAPVGGKDIREQALARRMFTAREMAADGLPRFLQLAGMVGGRRDRCRAVVAVKADLRLPASAAWRAQSGNISPG